MCWMYTLALPLQRIALTEEGSVRAQAVARGGTDGILTAAWVEQGVLFCLFVERLVGGCKV